MGSEARVGWVYHDRFLEHRTGWSHPERPERLNAVREGLEAAGLLRRMVPLEFEEAPLEAIARVHDPAYIEIVEMACEKGFDWVGSLDTNISAESYRVARLAVGGVLKACDEIIAGRLDRAFCAVRPPGHHAERNRAMGFCLFNNVALAAEHLVRSHGLERVAIVDFDVHHGNGTQHFFEERSDVLFVSLHESPQFLYPGTGWRSEIGRGEGEGYTINIPMPPGATDEDYIAAFDETVLPALEKHRPQCILVSAGFDAAGGESIAHLNLTEEAYREMTKRVVAVAERCCQGRVVSCLEGGYDLENLRRCASAHVRALLGGE